MEAADLLKLGEMGLELLGVGGVLGGPIDVRLEGLLPIGEFSGEDRLGIAQERCEGIGIVQFVKLF
jgi:hypothetical protein